MKLYATTTSERATKEQGGNHFIKTIITADMEQVVDVFIDDYNDDEYRVMVDIMGEVFFRTTPKTKGNK